MREYFAIFGNPVSHSKSPLMHNLTLKALGHNGCYGRYKLEEGSQLKEKFLSLQLKGINVTVPHKEAAFEACDYLDDFAKQVGAVNTIINRDGKLHGYNTDAPGLLKVIAKIENIKSILVLGAGGTARSTTAIFRNIGYEVTMLNRSQNRLKGFKESGFSVFTFENFEPKAFDLIINMTSAGLEDESLPAPQELLEVTIPQAKAIVDIIYGKETPFLRLAKKYAIATKDGSDMLLYQGIIAFEYFTNNAYSFEEIEKHMKRAFVL